MKAFDTVPHKRLIGKLKSYGIEYYTLRWIQAFLSDRVQQVNVNGTNPEWANITSGIPQGSVLGPILFVVYIIVPRLCSAIAYCGFLCVVVSFAFAFGLQELQTYPATQGLAASHGLHPAVFLPGYCRC